MKIIGMSDSSYIIEASKDEVANLIGYSSDYDRRNKGRELRVGENVCVSQMFEYLYKLGDGRRKLKEAAENLRAIAASVELVSPLIPLKKEEGK